MIIFLSSDSLWRRAMIARLNHDQQQRFYSFRLDLRVPHDWPVRKIAAVLDLSWVHSELAPFYPKMGRPSIDPELMIRMLIIGYVFAIRSERAICRDLQACLSCRRYGLWLCRPRRAHAEPSFRSIGLPRVTCPKKRGIILSLHHPAGRSGNDPLPRGGWQCNADWPIAGRAQQGTAMPPAVCGSKTPYRATGRRHA